MSIAALQEYTQVSKYANYNKELGRKETWSEQIDRVFNMHETYLGVDLYNLIRNDIQFTKNEILKKKILGSQRALQFGGDPILKKHARMYNCTATYGDRPRFFQEAFWLLLCGCGVGISLLKTHVKKLPAIKMPNEKNIKIFEIPDSIEGWADAIGVLMSSYFDSENIPFPEFKNSTVKFDYSKIRPAGSMISWGSKAPGPEYLRVAIENIRKLLNKLLLHSNVLRPIDVYDVIMHISDACLAGGVRRSAAIVLFSPDDYEMMNAKTGSWFIDNPQRGRSNNSVLFNRNEVTREMFDKIFQSVKEFGEPGFIFADDENVVFNPCGEISMYPSIEVDGVERSGWQFCNLSEINMQKCKTEEDFYEACKAAAIIGTIQAKYTKFDYLGEISEKIAQREALIGVSMTGMAETPEIAFNPTIQQIGAKIVLDTNERISKLLGINPAARSTCIKPSGTASCLLGTSSGIHPHHAKRYIRRVQANKLENTLRYFQQFNPLAVEESVWSSNKTDVIISFVCEVPNGAKTKNQVDALTLLENVKLTQQNWVNAGTRIEQCYRPYLRHNVSNTINVMPNEWDNVADYIFENKQWFAGISLLPVAGDKDYPQAPFTAVYKPSEIVREYGDGSMFASGLIVDAIKYFDNNLWAACDCVLNIGEIIDIGRLRKKIIIDLESNGEMWKLFGISGESSYQVLENWLNENVKHLDNKRDWVRRAIQFSNRYFEKDVRKMTYCLKDVFNWKLWCDLNREYVNVDWSQCFEDVNSELINNFGGAGEACSGGACEIGDLGAIIKEKQNTVK